MNRKRERQIFINNATVKNDTDVFSFLSAKSLTAAERDSIVKTEKEPICYRKKRRRSEQKGGGGSVEHQTGGQGSVRCNLSA